MRLTAPEAGESDLPCVELKARLHQNAGIARADIGRAKYNHSSDETGRLTNMLAWQGGLESAARRAGP